MGSTDPPATTPATGPGQAARRGPLQRLLAVNVFGPARRIPLPGPVLRARFALALLMARRPGVFAVANVLLLFVTLVLAMAAGGEARSAWHMLVVAPLLLLGGAILSDVVAVERRSGSLDLALSSPGARHLFERRLGAGLAVLLGQSWLVILVMWFSWSRGFALVPALGQALVLVGLLGAATLFWAVRLRTPGAVMLASVGTIALLGKWSLVPPMPELAVHGILLPPLAETLDWARGCAVLAAAGVLLYLHARRRLDRPELLLR